MSRRGWRYIIAAGGLATVVLTTGLLYATWRYASPQEPRIARYEAAQRPERDYQPGGASCDPKRLNALPSEQAPPERDRCAQAAVDYRAKQAELRQTTRANDLAEGDLRLAYQQARIAFAQTIATVLAFVAAALAAVFAGLAVYHSKRSADADNLALRATRRAAREARSDAAEAALRFKEQMDKTKEMVEFTAKSSHAMERSATATRGMANATRRGVELAAENTAKQLRPYVYIINEKVSISVFHVGGLGGRPQAFPTDDAPVSFSIRNFGLTPAKRVRIRARVFHGEHWTDGGRVDLEETATIHRADMPPGFERPISGYAATGIADAYDNLTRGEASIFFDGVIEYEDAAGGSYKTNFRRVCTGAEDIQAGRFFITQEGNEAT